MLSGTGRHRRPRQAPAFLVTAGVTSAGIALPLLGAGAAQAVSDGAWDRAAECVSGGEWTANTGNGYYGAFQLTMEMWRQYGGMDFAARPDLASRDQQIAVVEAMLADQGQEALPGCALMSGLWEEFRAERDAAAAEDAQGTGDAEAEDQSGEASGETEEADGTDTADEAGESGEADEAGAVGESGESGDAGATGSEGSADQGGSDASGSAEAPEAQERPDGQAEANGSGGGSGEGTGRHRGNPDPAETEAGGAEARQPGQSGGGRHAGEPAPEEREAGGTSQEGAGGQGGQGSREGAGAAGGVYEVQQGDTLSGIAASKLASSDWTGLYQENESVIGDDPDYILPGQELELTVAER